MKRKAKIAADRRTSLRYALPYLIFILIPVWDIVQGGLWTPVQVASLALLAAMVALYVYLWIASPVAPLGPVGPRFWVPFTLLVLALLAMTLVGAEDHPGLAFMWTYVASPWALLAPRKRLPGGAALLLAATVASTFLVGVPSYLVFMAAIVFGLTGGMGLVVRSEADRTRVEDSKRVAKHQLELERERTQMNSDLHDILGQDLTGLSIKADLAVRFLEAGRKDEAAAEMASIADLARAAMEDVRSVSRSRREWSIDHELGNAEDLLAARGITLHLDRADTAFPGKLEGAAARVLRESVTNLLRHAEAANCWIELSPTRLSVKNDGCQKMSVQGESGAESGLAHLQERVQDSGRLRWSQEGLFWTVTFDIGERVDQ